MLPEGHIPNLMLLAGVSLMAAILLRRIYRRKRRSKKKQPSRLESAKQTQPLLDAPREITRWQVEMHEVARELRAELDTKAVMVQTLIGMLRQETNRLEQVLASSKDSGMEPLDPDLLAEIKQLSAEIGRGSDDSLRKADHAVDNLNELADPGSHDERIYPLADQGMLSSEIATLLSLSVTDVERTLRMRSI